MYTVSSQCQRSTLFGCFWLDISGFNLQIKPPTKLRWVHLSTKDMGQVYNHLNGTSGKNGGGGTLGMVLNPPIWGVS